MKISIKIILILILATYLVAQHRGDQLAFQGFGNELQGGLKASALGNAFTAGSGELEAIFYNPAGLASISGLQFSISGQNYENIWRENQAYRSNRQVTTMSLILDGLITPNPANNGLWDHDAFKNDTNYIAVEPIIGKNAYSKAAADWQKKRKKSFLNNIAVAYPLSIMERQFVFSAAYFNSFPVNDFDRNQTYLDPHPGSNIYNDIIPRVVAPADSVRINWYDYSRQRFGDIYNFRFAIASNITENFFAGLSFNVMDGETEEFQSLNKVGWFDLLATANNFIFSYDTLNTMVQGKSSFKTFSVQGGFQFHFDNMSIGLTLNLPHTIKRGWKLESISSVPDSVSSTISSGSDELEVPLSYSLGIVLNPIQNFKFYLDYKYNNFADATFKFESQNTTQRSWKNQQIYSIGVEYTPIDLLSLMIGYQNIPQVYVADGAAVQDKGPEQQSFSFGLSANIPYGQANFVYQFSELKYEDIYYSNTNYNYQSTSRILFGYTLKL